MSLVYLADSCQLTRTMLIRFLHEAGIDAKPLCHAKEIVTALSQAGVYSHTENVILIHDLESNNCGGFNVIQLIRKMPVSKRLRILGITFSKPQNQLNELKRYGIDAYILREDLSRGTLIPLVQRLSYSSNHHTISAIELTHLDQEPKNEPCEQPKPLSSLEFDRAVISVAKAKSIKPVVHEVLRIASDNRSDINDLVEVIRNDPSMTAKVVGASNTVFYRRTGGEVKNLQEAVSLLGVNSIQELALSLNIADDINDGGLDPILQLPKLWGHSIATAHLAEWIASNTGICDPGQAYVVGILHDFGRRLMTWQLPAHYKQVLKSKDAVTSTLLERERQFVGIDHAILASRVLDRWGCPPFLGRTIALHHSQMAWDKQSLGRIYDLVRVVQIADALAIAFGFEADDTDDIPVIPVQWLFEIFHDPDEQSRRMWGTLIERIALLMGRSNYPIELPAACKSHVAQFVMMGARPMELEPLQATLLRGFTQSRVVAPARADLSENATIIVLDWRSLDLTDCISSINWLIGRDDLSHWPLLIVGYPDGFRSEAFKLPNLKIQKLSGMITPSAVLKAIDELTTHFIASTYQDIEAA